MSGIGLFGGTFNPIHTGHLKVADDIRVRFNLGKIYFIPSAVPPHKGVRDLADAKDRYQMILGALPPGKGFIASDVEILRQGPSYTIDTVRYFKDRLISTPPCYLIVGMDAFLELDTWKSFQKLLDLIPLIVMTRPAQDKKESAAPSDELKKYIYGHVDSGYVFVHESSSFVHPEKQPVLLSHVTAVDISSTQIRNCIRRKASIKGMVPGTVEKYIYEKGLYL